MYNSSRLTGGTSNEFWAYASSVSCESMRYAQEKMIPSRRLGSTNQKCDTCASRNCITHFWQIDRNDGADHFPSSLGIALHKQLCRCCFSLVSSSKGYICKMGPWLVIDAFAKARDEFAKDSRYSRSYRLHWECGRAGVHQPGIQYSCPGEKRDKPAK